MTEKYREVSVVIAVKNDAKRLKVLLDSIANLPERPQVVVVDNGSTDDSVEVARKAGAEVFCFPGLRVGALRNRGVEHATGVFLAFADSDHQVPSDWINAGVRVLRSSTEIAAAGSHYLPPPKGTWVQRVWAIHRLRGDAPRDVDWLGAGNLFVRRADFELVGGFDEVLVAAEDVDLCFRLRGLGKRIVCDHDIRSVHHGEPRTLWHFLKKEYWRGSSGVRAWVAQGFPLRDLPSLVWPLWHLVVGISVFSLLFLSVGLSWHLDLTWLALGVVLWLLPSAAFALRTAIQTGNVGVLFHLWLLYFSYGLARAFALFRR